MSRPVSTGETRCGGSATPLSPPPPGPYPPEPLPLPVPVPPAPVPGPANGAEPWVGIVPCRGVSLAAIWGTGGTTTFGLGASTGVASLLMLGGAEPPSFSLGLGCCFCGGGGGGGGGGGWLMSNTRITLWAPGRFKLGERCKSMNSNAACMATTDAIALPRSRLLMFVR